MNQELAIHVTPAERVPVSQGYLFRWVRWRILCNAGTLIMGNSRVRLITMILCSLVVCAFVFFSSLAGFRFLSTSDIKSMGVVVLLFDSMFFTLGGMLVFSTGLIVYASLFTGAETRFLLTTPARADHIFAMKLQSALAFSSWGFLILGAPILVAYGLAYEAVWYFYVLLPIFFVGYVLLPGGAGAILALAIVNFFPHKRKQALIVISALVVLIGGYWLYHLIVSARHSQGNRDAIQGVFDLFVLANSTVSPSHWLSTGLVNAAQGDGAESLYWLCLIWSNGLLVYLIGTFAAKHLYRRGFNRMSTGGDLRRRYGRHWLDKIMNSLVFFVDEKTRHLIIKDFRTFRREPAQISQLIIFAVLLILCVANSRQFFRADIPVSYQYGLSLLNLSATGLLTAAYLARFIYPLISLEGRKFWILGLLPLKREQLLWGKFAFAVVGTTLFAMTMVLLSDLVLGMPLFAIGLHLLTMMVLVLGLSGMSVGLSAWMPNFRETDPSKIVVGFGGTLNMILSLLYLVAVIILMLIPYHITAAAQALLKTPAALPPWASVCIGLGVLLGIAAVYFPMRIGIRTLRGIEF
jgi:ABC-2 type transport system permease protein